MPLQLSDPEYAIIGLFTLIIIVFSVYWITRKWTETRSELQKVKGTKDEDDSIKILKLRLAKGDITRAEYEELRKTLESS